MKEEMKKQLNKVDIDNIKRAIKMTGALSIAFTGVGLIWFWKHFDH